MSVQDTSPQNQTPIPQISSGSSTDDLRDDERISFVPDELCFVLKSESRTRPDRVEDLYAILTRFLETRFPRDQVPGDRFPDLVRALVPLHRERFVTAFLPQAQGAAHHLYFRRLAPINQSSRDSNSDMRYLILRLNLELDLQTGTPQNLGDGLTLHAVTPHWIGGACPGGNDDNPAAPPIAVPKNQAQPNWQFRFVNGSRGRADLNQMVQDYRKKAVSGAPSSGTVVAILDTAPKEKRVDEAVTNHQGNLLLSKVDPDGRLGYGGGASGPEVEFDGTLTSSTRSFMHLHGLVGPWLGRFGPIRKGTSAIDIAEVQEESYKMSDHGLFAAGIIKDIAPLAPIHLLRAVDDKGMTDVNTLAGRVSALYEQDWAKNATHLIVNLSVTFAVPTLPLFLNRWDSPLLDEFRRRGGDPGQLYNLLSRNLEDVIGFLDYKGALVVSAAGNFDDPDARRDEPRYPALDPRVLAVAAINRADQPAAYSNPADVANHTATNAHGIATYGGNTDPNGGQPVIAGGTTADPDAIRGIFSAKYLPHSGGDNESGWAYWVGTSFSTPVIAGLAAVLWDQDGNTRKTASQMIPEVLKYGDIKTTQADLHCDAIFAEQVAVNESIAV
jgi:hypothetical protein